MVHLICPGSYKKTESYLENLQGNKFYVDFDHYGRMGVDALSSATPIDTGETAHSWGYEVKHEKDRHTIYWFNTHTHNGVHIAIILQYGHGTGTGGWVDGQDYINPALRPLFDKMVDDIWRQVING